MNRKKQSSCVFKESEMTIAPGKRCGDGGHTAAVTQSILREE
jgi:hypothetical protein